MSRVFLATEVALGRQVVVKVLPPETAASVSIERFKREIQLAARLQHPHIVPLHSAGETEGLPYFTMPFVEGESLRVRLAKHGEMPVAEAIRVLREVASALAYAHERGIVHRDIKPDNVLLSGGSAMVTDFGVAKALSTSSNADHGGMTSLGVALGTPAYMSPEQASADPTVDHRADIYAFGVLAYELLTGQTPFGGRTPQGLLAAHVTEPPEPIQKRRPSIPPALAALVMRCLEKRPADRPQSAAEVVHALDDLNTPSGGMSPTSAVAGVTGVATSATGSTSSRKRAAMIATGVALALAIVAALVFASKRASSAASTARTGAKSIAVLPLVNAGGDSTMQFFADGMTDELTTTVARIPGLRVASRNATTSAMQAGTEVRSLGQRLGVAAVLDGRLRRSGNTMRLTATLTNASDGLILWTQTYDREVKDAFQMQDDVARAIASALRVALGSEQGQLTVRGTADPEAHDLYLRGRYLLAKYNEPDIRKALVLFQSALKRDSSFAMAWSGVADAWGFLADDFISPREAVPHMREAIARGLAIDSTLPDLRASRAVLSYFYDRNAKEARVLMESALRATPGYRESFVQILWASGLRDSANSYVRLAVEREPTSPDLLRAAQAWNLGNGAPEFATAQQYCTRLLELNARSGCPKFQAEARGHPEDAIIVYRSLLADSNPRRVASARLNLVRTLAAAGRGAEARPLVLAAEAEAERGTRYVREDWTAMMWGYLGDNDRALQWYERADRSGSSGIGSLYWDLRDNPLRRDPRVLALAKRAGLPDPPAYWK